jgi:hypothetical protein
MECLEEDSINQIITDRRLLLRKIHNRNVLKESSHVNVVEMHLDDIGMFDSATIQTILNHGSDRSRKSART